MNPTTITAVQIALSALLLVSTRGHSSPWYIGLGILLIVWAMAVRPLLTRSIWVHVATVGALAAAAVCLVPSLQDAIMEASAEGNITRAWVALLIALGILFAALGLVSSRTRENV